MSFLEQEVSPWSRPCCVSGPWLPPLRRSHPFTEGTASPTLPVPYAGGGRGVCAGPCEQAPMCSVSKAAREQAPTCSVSKAASVRSGCDNKAPQTTGNCFLPVPESRGQDQGSGLFDSSLPGVSSYKDMNSTLMTLFNLN